MKILISLILPFLLISNIGFSQSDTLNQLILNGLTQKSDTCNCNELTYVRTGGKAIWHLGSHIFTGFCTYLYDNYLFEKHYEEGIHTKQIIYYESGKKASESWRLKHKSKSWYENGKKKSKNKLIRFKLYHKTIRWDESGKRIKSIRSISDKSLDPY